MMISGSFRWFAFASILAAGCVGDPTSDTAASVDGSEVDANKYEAKADGVVEGTATPSEDGDHTNCGCGDGNLDESAGESCDDGNNVSGDGCSATCDVEPPPPTTCGNEVVESGEQCDDGNTSSNDGCSASCQIEPPPGVCGNEILEAGEQCDDGNTSSNDGCSQSCMFEPLSDGVTMPSLRMD